MERAASEKLHLALGCETALLGCPQEGHLESGDRGGAEAAIAHHSPRPLLSGLHVAGLHFLASLVIRCGHVTESWPMVYDQGLCGHFEPWTLRTSLV